MMRITTSTSPGGQIQTLAKGFLDDEGGATAIEYSLIGGLISIAIIVSLTAVSDTVSEMYDTIDQSLSNG